MTPQLLGVPWPTIVAGGVALMLVAIVGLTIRSIIKGDLVPRQHLVDTQAERDKWEAAWKLSQSTIGELDARLEANTEALRLMQQLVDALATRSPSR